MDRVRIAAERTTRHMRSASQSIHNAMSQAPLPASTTPQVSVRAEDHFDVDSPTRNTAQYMPSEQLCQQRAGIACGAALACHFYGQISTYISPLPARASISDDWLSPGCGMLIGLAVGALQYGNFLIEQNPKVRQGPPTPQSLYGVRLRAQALCGFAGPLGFRLLACLLGKKQKALPTTVLMESGAFTACLGALRKHYPVDTHHRAFSLTLASCMGAFLTCTLLSELSLYGSQFPHELFNKLSEGAACGLAVFGVYNIVRLRLALLPYPWPPAEARI